MSESLHLLIHNKVGSTRKKVTSQMMFLPLVAVSYHEQPTSAEGHPLNEIGNSEHLKSNQTSASAKKINIVARFIENSVPHSCEFTNLHIFRFHMHVNPMELHSFLPSRFEKIYHEYFSCC